MKTLTETSTFRVLSLLLCLCFFIPAMNVSASSLQADKFKVSGIVKDATGEPVIGASVVEKGTTNGTVTDLDGNFNLTVASNSTIVISFIEGGNLAASKIRNLECPNYEICLIDYGCGKFNRKIHIMEQYP